MPVRKARFRSSGDLIAVLGAEMIGDKVAGLVELIKNAWDADAAEISLELQLTASPSETVLVLRDNGFGMTIEDVLDRWLVPATKAKRDQKSTGQRSPMGRLPLGEKGIGRFACQKLAHQLELVTRAADSTEVVLNLDWDAFEDGRPLDDIEFEVEDRTPVMFRDAPGTQLTMRQAREPWLERDIARLQRDIRRLQRPSVDAMTQSEFVVRFVCPEFPQYEDVAPPDLQSKRHYGFTAYVDSDGTCDWEYACEHPDVAARESQGKSDLTKLSDIDLCCGPFFIALAAWDRSPPALKEVELVGRDLDPFCGVSVYRDGMRVYPYGQPGDDWLHLDRERPNNPSKLLGNNQVVGMVQFDQADNPSLTDKANRDGLQDNSTFRSFHALTRAAIAVFTAEWNKDKSERKREIARTDAGAAALPAARRIAEALQEGANADKTVSLPSDAYFHPTGETDGANQDSTIAVPEPAAVGALLGTLDQVEEEIEFTRNERSMLYEVTAAGMAAHRASHEFLRQVASARSAAKALRESVRGARQSELARTVEVALQSLANEIRVIAPDPIVVGGNERNRAVNTGDLLSTAIALSTPAAETAGIVVTTIGDPILYWGRLTPGVQIVDNLLDNAIRWAGGEHAPCVTALTDPLSRSIVICDNGGGIDPAIGDDAFEPFASMRVDGRGLGLYIARELARGMGGDVTVGNQADWRELQDLPGACFVFQLPPESRP